MGPALRDILSDVDVQHRFVDLKDESSIHLSSIPIRGNTTKYVYLDLYFHPFIMRTTVCYY